MEFIIGLVIGAAAGAAGAWYLHKRNLEQKLKDMRDKIEEELRKKWEDLKDKVE
jgi:hypothetical protein